MATRKSTSKTVTKPAATKPAAAKPARPAASAAAEVPKATTAKPRPTRVPPAAKSAEPPSPLAPAAPVGGDRYRWIAHAAYLKAEHRGFVPGREVEDWLEAESEFLAAFGLKPT